MIKIKILCIGNLKENYLLAMQNEYLKRLTNYAKDEIKEEKEEKSNEINDSLVTQILNKEGERFKRAWLFCHSWQGTIHMSEGLEAQKSLNTRD